jgi:hypothetical protein
MAALTAARDVVRNGFDAISPSLSVPVKASTKIFQGALVVVDSTGYALTASAAASLRAIGVAEATADNSSGADAAIQVRVRRGAFWFGNKAGDLVTQAMVFGGTAPAIEDNQTVRATATSSSTFGKLLAVDATLGALVEIY